MKNKNGYFGISLMLVIALSVMLPSCKEDEPFVKPKLSFGESELTFKESEGEVEIKIILDKAYTKDIEIDYSISGTAGEAVKVGSSGDADYKITSDYLTLEIESGETEGIITLEFFSDVEIEDDETIEIQIEDVDSEEIELTRDDEINITLEQEDGLIVALAWGVGTGEKYTDVDMDLFLWVEDDAATLVNSGFGSFQSSTVSPEFFFLPTALLDDGTYGLSCNYYSGTVEPMNFQVTYIKWVNGAASGVNVVKKGTYTLANINAWDESETDPIMVMTFEKLGAEFKDFSDITVPSAGSRSISIKLPEGLTRTTEKHQLPAILKLP
jgi:hypothetical protein